MKRIIIVVVFISILAGVTAVPSYAQSGCTQTHRVVWGENLFRIGLRYGVTVTYLQTLNGLPNSNFIYAGQLLCVETGYVPQPPPPPYPNAYMVQWGDSLRAIAQRFGVDMWVLARVNNIVNVNLIYAGQLLTIPEITIQ